MPPRRQPRQAKSQGYDPTAQRAAISSARILTEEKPSATPEKTNDDLKNLIETLKNKMGINQPTTKSKQVPPQPKAKGTWNRSINTWSARPAYTVLTRVSNHELVPTKSTKQNELTINALPHAFLYKPGADGIKVDKLSIKSGKQLSWG